MFFEVFFNSLIIVYILHTFTSNKTINQLGFSLLIFFISFAYIIYINFELVALAFIITYIGGVAIMFLFLILALDVNTENFKLKKSYKYNVSYIYILHVVLIILLVNLVFLNYNPFLFNNFEYFDSIFKTVFINNNNTQDGCLWLETSMDPFSRKIIANRVDDVELQLDNFILNLFDFQGLEKFNVNTNYLEFLNNRSVEFNLSLRLTDVLVLGVYLYDENCWFLLCLIAIFLLAALIISIYVGSGVFQFEKL